MTYLCQFYFKGTLCVILLTEEKQKREVASIYDLLWVYTSRIYFKGVLEVARHCFTSFTE